MNLKTRLFREFIEEQLSSLPNLSVRRLFSGFGLYSGDVVFGLIHGEKLYFHTDDQSKERYEKLGSTSFTTPGSKKTMKRYYEVPVSIVEDKKNLLEWAEQAVATKK